MPDDNNTHHKAKKSGVSPPRSDDTGAALRSVYQKTVDEQVPDDLLDLLGKLD